MLDKKKALINLLEIYSDFEIDFVMDTNKNITEKAITMSQSDAKDETTPKESNKFELLRILREEVENFEGCELKVNSTNTVFSDGNFESSIMIIGEAPGANEDLHGIPFCGASGKLLDKMLDSIGLDRNSVYITNTIFWRPPNNRRPTNEEIETCRPFLERHITIIDPQIIILVGSTATVSVMRTQENISKVRGKFYSYTNKFLNKDIAVTAIFHPAYLMRQPMQKKLAWEDLKLIRNFLDGKQIPSEA